MDVETEMQQDGVAQGAPQLLPLFHPLSMLGMGGPGATRDHGHPSPPVTLLHTGCYHGQKLAGWAGANGR